MKITKENLETIIKEELEALIENGELDEGFFDRLGARAAAAKTAVGSKIKGAAQKGVGKLAGAVGAKDIGDQLAATGAATQAAGKEKALATKRYKIVNARLNELIVDLGKLGISLQEPGIRGAITALQNAVQRFLTKAGVESQEE